MKKYFHYMILAVAMCLLHSCQEDSFTTATGSFNIILMDESAEAQKRSLPADLSDELKKQFIIRIENEDGKKTYNGNLGAYQTNTPALKPGQYSLQATYGENKALAIDEPYYISAKEGATIEANQTTDITLLCSVGNALASFAFSDPEKPAEIFTSYTFVTTVNGESVSCTADDGRNPYFREGATVDFYLQGTTTDNKQINYKFASISSATRQTNYKYTLTIGATAEGNADLDISVNTTVSSITINETLPEEWLPKAKLSADGFDETNTLNYRETTDASTTRINYQAVKPIEDVEITLNFEDPNLSSLSKTYLFSEMTEEERSQLIEAGMTLPELNTTSGSLDLTSTTSRLLCTNDGNTAVNKINMRVKANNRWSETKEYTINTLRPEFNIVVNEGDFWSKEFAIREFNVTEGNIEKIKAKTIYQYSENDGASWVTCSDGMAQKFSTHPENKNYKVRALYRGVLASNIADVTLETPTQLPNSGMEDWYEEDLSNNKNLWYPYLQGSNGFLWNTNNLETTNYRNESYCSTSSVKQTTNKHNGTYAAWIRTVGHGIANTNVDSFLGINGSITGTHTIGQLFFSNSFTVRPTKLTFYYRYIPNGDDNGIIELKIENQEQGSVLYEASKTITENTNYALFEVPINYSITNIPATNLTITFKSGSKHTNVVIAKVRGNGANEHYGSELYIDDISLIYDR